MAAASVRKFIISLDAEEAVDFAEPVDWFGKQLAPIGFVPHGPYTFIFRDAECMMKVELNDSQDGFFVFLYVQAADEHAFRAAEVAKAFDAFAVETSGTKRFTLEG